MIEVSSILHHPPSPVRLAARSAPATAAAAFLLTIAACSSSSSAAPASAVPAAVQQDCVTIADILSSGPDPGADSVGYAEAQVLPLRQLKIGDDKLQKYVLALADAYAGYSAGSDPGSRASAAAVTKAENEVNTICPEAAP